MSTDEQSWRGHEIAFGPFRLDPQQRVLLRADTPVRLGSRALEILVLLAERAGEIVKKRELMARVWPDSVVEEGTLRVHVASLRKALGGSQAGMRYVENVNGQGYRFVAPLRRADERPANPAQLRAAEHPHEIPGALTRMIGRTSVLAMLTSRLPQERFVTIVGPGGIGKTTLALATAEQLRASYADSSCFVDLASITDPLLISGTLASALGLASMSQDQLSDVIDFLKNRQMLILLDNCEHVVEAAALLAERLLRGAPGIHVLATSREPLRARGEWVLRLPPLTVPSFPAALDPAEALRFSAIELFVERAAASSNGFELSESDVRAVADICCKLDGLPLAIELAAARVDMFGVQGLAANLHDRLGLLTRGRRTAVPRHRTLRAMLAWSYDILCDVEQITLRRLAVFAGAFDISSARAVMTDAALHGVDVLDVLANLAAKSLLAMQVAGEHVRYRLLDTSRAYALEKLEGSDESAQIRRRHAQLCASWGADELDWRPPEWTAANSRRIGDVRAALDWCFSPEGEPLLGVQLTAGSAPIWFQSSFLTEYQGRVERALQSLKMTGMVDAALELHLTAILGAASLYATGASRRVTAAFERTLALAERLGSVDHQRRALWGLWAASVAGADYSSSLGFAEHFCLLASTSADPGAVVVGDRMMSVAHHLIGHHATARRHAERALAASAGAGTATKDWPSPLEQQTLIEHRVALQATLARILWVQGYPDQALDVGRESLRCAQATGHPMAVCLSLTCLCKVVLWTGDLVEAKRLIATLLDHSGQHSLAYWHFWGRSLQLALARRLGETRDARAVLSDLHCSPLHQETLATFNAGLATKEIFARAENGLAGWSVAELLRIKAERLLSEGDTTAAEALLQRSLDVARGQGALAWELRTTTSLARLRLGQRRAREAHDVLATVCDRFAEGFATADLLEAGTVLEAMSIRRTGTR